MRILTIADVQPDPDAGVAGTELHTNAALRALGHEVDARWHDDLGPMRISHGNLRYLLELPVRLEQLVRRAGKYDIVHITQPHGYRAARVAQERGAVFVHRSHGVEPRVEEELRRWSPDGRSRSRRLASAIIRPALSRHFSLTTERAHGHIVNCSDDADYLHLRFGVPRERIAIVAPAPPTAFSSDTPPAMSAERFRRVLYVSQFARFKAPEIVAAVMRDVATTHELTWVCSRAHHEQVRQLVGARVQLLDWMPASELRRVYDEHGVFLFPSYVEGYGKVFLEAMSRGLCVIASDTSGARDAITNGVDGLLVPVGDAASISSAVRALKFEQAVAMSTAAAQAAQQYTWERAARQTVAFFERLRQM